MDKFKQFFREQTGKEWDERANGKMPPPKTDMDGNTLPVHEGWFYLEEKTTILGAFLREPQSTAFQGSSDIACDGVKEDNIEEKMANHQVKDGGEDGCEADDHEAKEEMDG